MKIKATFSSDGRTAYLACMPMFGADYILRARKGETENGHTIWVLNSGRFCTDAMLDAIDRA